MKDKDKDNLKNNGYTKEEFDLKFNAMLAELGILPKKNNEQQPDTKNKEQQPDTKKLEIKMFPKKI